MSGSCSTAERGKLFVGSRKSPPYGRIHAASIGYQRRDEPLNIIVARGLSPGRFEGGAVFHAGGYRRDDA